MFSDEDIDGEDDPDEVIGSFSLAASAVHGSSTSRRLEQNIAQQMAVQVERLGLKVERIQRIRSVFEAQAGRLAKAVLSRVDAAQERVSLSLHRVSENQSRVDNARTLIERDKRQRDQEANEMKRFKDEVGSRHLSFNGLKP